MKISTDSNILEKAKLRCQLLRQHLEETQKAERTAFVRYMENAENYPQRGWNKSFREKIAEIRSEMDDCAKEAISIVDRGTHLEYLSLSSETMKARLNKFWSEVWGEK